MTYLDYLEKKVLLERLVIGLEEPVLVKGLGELQAKIDSGNGGYIYFAHYNSSCFLLFVSLPQ